MIRLQPNRKLADAEAWLGLEGLLLMTLLQPNDEVGDLMAVIGPPAGRREQR